MNDHTEAVLDYPLMRNALQAYAVTPMGKRFAAQLHPHADATALDVQLRETSEMAAALAVAQLAALAPVVDLHSHPKRRRLVVFISKACSF
jgi:dsDNA-specific endonuclease/ATPase MutS2